MAGFSGSTGVSQKQMTDAIAQSTADVIRTGDVINNLTSTATDKPGSANMLKTLNDKLTIKSKTFSVNTGGTSQVTFNMDNTEQIPIHVVSDANDIFSLAVRNGSNWKFAFGRLTLEKSLNNTYIYEAKFNLNINITVYYID